MSRGFVKEEDQEEAPIIPPRAFLPEGVTNYVTPDGMEELFLERKQLEAEKAALSTEDEDERRRARAFIDGKLELLNRRIQSARILNSSGQPKDEIRFGATVKMRNIQNGQVQNFRIVGVDQADVKKSLIAFVAPLARAVTGKKIGQKAELRLGRDIRTFEILEINYGD